MRSDPTVFFIADDALGIRVDSKTDRHTLADRLRLSQVWTDVIPGADGVSVRYDPIKLDPDKAVKLLEQGVENTEVTSLTNTGPSPRQWVIPVCYAPEFALDMDEICAATNLNPNQIVARHTQTLFRVDMIGFTPGFAYLDGRDFDIDLPRLKTPRAHVLPGSVGLARTQCGLYALGGPGGWPVIGRTPFVLFDANASSPFRLTPGDSVKFEPISKTEYLAAIK